MKKLSVLFIVLLLTSCTGYQYITEQERYLTVIEEHPMAKDKAYDVTIEWIATKFRSANTVVQLKEKENGKIILQAVDSYYFDILKTVLVDYNYTLSIKIIDNKIKYEFTINNVVGKGGGFPQKGDLPKILANFKATHTAITNALKNYKEDSF